MATTITISGMWYSILNFVNVCGVISNAFLIAFTSSYGKQYDLEHKLIIIIVFEVRTNTLTV